jgi:hypothetical protein
MRALNTPLLIALSFSIAWFAPPAFGQGSTDPTRVPVFVHSTGVTLQARPDFIEGLFGTSTKTVSAAGHSWRCSRRKATHYDAQGNEAATLSGTCRRGHQSVTYNSAVYG